jgi:hypothetical protein
MSLCVNSPHVAWILLESKTGSPSSSLELPVLLQAEGMHPEDESEAWCVHRPGPQHSVNNLTEFTLLTDEEIEVLRDLEGEEIVRIMEQGALEEAGGAFPFTVGPRLGR